MVSTRLRVLSGHRRETGDSGAAASDQIHRPRRLYPPSLLDYLVTTRSNSDGRIVSRCSTTPGMFFPACFVYLCRRRVVRNDKHRSSRLGTHRRWPDVAQRDVLIVEEDPKVRDLLRQIFDAAGYACQLADDGREGLEAFKAGRPPLVVTDLRTPGMTGIELLRQARAVDGDVAVIVLTGAGDVMNAIESVKLGAHAFLMKPINVDELLITAARALERRQLLIERRRRREPCGQSRQPDREILIVEDDPVHRDIFHQVFL